MRSRGRILAVLVLWTALPAAAGTVSLQWDPVTDADLSGYRVYYGTTSHSYTGNVDVGNVTSTTVTGLADCTTWFLAVKAYDLAGNESTSYSNEISGMPRPSIASVSPTAAEQGRTLALTITGANFTTGATVTFGATGIVPGSATVLSCTQISVNVTVGAAALVGATTIEVENPNQVFGVSGSIFTVQAAANPAVSSTVPNDGATGVAVTVHPTVTFSEAMLPSSVTSATVRLLDEASAAVAQAGGSPSLSPDGKTATITPLASLAQGQTYRLQAVGGVSGVQDLAGHAMAATFTQPNGFDTTGDTTAPVISVVASSSVLATTARVTWTTSEAADSQVFYRKSGDTAYQQTAVAPALVTSHQVDLAGLVPSTTYEYHVRSADAAGNAATSSPDKTLTTASSTFSYLRMEAEQGTLTSPVRTIAGAGAFGGAWVDTPAGTPTGTSGSPAGTSVLGVNVPTTGTWYLWVRMHGADTLSDTWFESIDGATRQQMTASPTGAFVWVEGRSYTLTAGLHTIELGGREAQSRADRVILTNDSAFVPTEQAVGDVTPPAKVTTFTAVPGSASVALSWKNPSDVDYRKTVVRYRTDGKFPTSPVDGFLVVEKTAAAGSTDTFTHSGLTNGTTYFYGAFPVDASGNVASATTSQATPADASAPGVVGNVHRSDTKN